MDERYTMKTQEIAGWINSRHPQNRPECSDNIALIEAQLALIDKADEVKVGFLVLCGILMVLAGVGYISLNHGLL